MPSDEKQVPSKPFHNLPPPYLDSTYKTAQFECMQAAHIVYMILDHAAPNPLFRAPVGDNAQNILDIGTGDGTWAVEVADRFPGGKFAARILKGRNNE